jgi:hypothetical protein
LRSPAALCLSSSLLVSVAQAHDWYPERCCHGEDCAVLPDGAVRTSPEGWVVTTTGETIPFDDPRIMRSPDGRFHQCIFPTERHTTQCIFVPNAEM